MQNESRTKNSIKNLIVALLMQLLTVLASFVCRTIFVKLISEEYLGLSGLFTNIISILSLSELGIGSAIIVNLYKPIAENDEIKIAKLMNFYRKFYTIIGIFVIFCGIILLPFLNYFIKTDVEIPHIKLYFLLFVCQSASSYFFSYKQALLTASQKEYICSLIRQAFNLLMNALQILILFLTKAYLFYLIVSIVTNLGTNITISVIADKKFSFLRKMRKEKIDELEKKSMYKSVFSMAIHKFGNTLINSTDNILISSLIGIVITGRYSNYVLIINIIAQLTTMMLNAVSAGIGDFVSRKTKEEVKDFFISLVRMNLWVYGMSAICFCCLFQPTISLWIGDNFLLEYDVVLLVSINFFINGIMKLPSMFVDVSGLYLKTRWKPMLMAVVNLAVSYVAAINWGLIGIFVGTIACYFVGLWVDPHYLYKYYFNNSEVKYYFRIGVDVLAAILIGIATYYLVNVVNAYLFKVVISLAVSNLLFFIYYCKSKEFKFFIQRVKIIFKKEGKQL